MNQRIDRIDVREYLAKHRATAEFNDEGPFSKLPLPTNAISKVADPQNWTCFPALIVRIYLTAYEDLHVIGIGDFEYPTICTKVFETLDEACAWVASRPALLSRDWLEQEGFEFRPIKPIRIA
jgi:hypothetical protein